MATAVMADITLVPRSPVATAPASTGMKSRTAGCPRPNASHVAAAVATNTMIKRQYQPLTGVRHQTSMAGVIRAMPNPLANTKRRISDSLPRNGEPSASFKYRPQINALRRGGNHAAPNTMARIPRRSSNLARFPMAARTMAVANAVSATSPSGPTKAKCAGSPLKILEVSTPA